jgi:hypothetical protein
MVVVPRVQYLEKRSDSAVTSGLLVNPITGAVRKLLVVRMGLLVAHQGGHGWVLEAVHVHLLLASLP